MERDALESGAPSFPSKLLSISRASVKISATLCRLKSPFLFLLELGRAAGNTFGFLNLSTALAIAVLAGLAPAGAEGEMTCGFDACDVVEHCVSTPVRKLGNEPANSDLETVLFVLLSAK